MGKSSVVTAKATGGWSYSFSLTERHAYEILNAPVGHSVLLGDQESLRMSSRDVAVHEKTRNGYKHEELDREVLLEALRKMIAESAWA